MRRMRRPYSLMSVVNGALVMQGEAGVWGRQKKAVSDPVGWKQLQTLSRACVADGVEITELCSLQPCSPQPCSPQLQKQPG